ncbi:MAG: metallophosphoesterase family protein [Bacteroidetes bacterium]|nr:MAG: metallophosphoesterase family protein [Bacteroidota bacterium]
MKKWYIDRVMTTAVISDIHGNLEALTAALEEIDRLGIRRTVCLGDVVGYGADPAACIDRLRERGIPAVMGNHDKAAAGLLDTSDFSTAARAGIAWTASRLTPEHTDYLASLPLFFSEPEAMYVHSSPDRPEEFRYLLRWEDAEKSFGAFPQELCFVGHTHRPVIFGGEGVERALRPGGRYIVNAGSVGQPRDGDPRSCICLFDTERREVRHVRLRYDAETARRKILDAGLPPKLGDRLLVGL